MNRITLAAFVLATLSTAAIAQSNDEQQACMNDAFRVCSATIPDRSRTFACMVQNVSQLSPACQSVIGKYAAAGGPPAPAATTHAPVRTVKNASLHPVKTASASRRPGKPLNILMR
jgi:hypothetical protein